MHEEVLGQLCFKMKDELRALSIGNNPEKFLNDWDIALLEHPRRPTDEDLYTVFEEYIRMSFFT